MYSRGSSITHAQEGMLSYFHRFSVCENIHNWIKDERII